MVGCAFYLTHPLLYRHRSWASSINAHLARASTNATLNTDRMGLDSTRRTLASPRPQPLSRIIWYWFYVEIGKNTSRGTSPNPKYLIESSRRGELIEYLGLGEVRWEVFYSRGWSWSIPTYILRIERFSWDTGENRVQTHPVRALKQKIK